MHKYLLGLLLLPIGALAQITDSIPEPTRLTEVQISALHISDSVMNAPASVAILTQSDILRNNRADIAPVFNMVAGVLMQSGNYNTNRISIRGIGARTPYGTNKIRAFFGNIPLTSGDSETTIEDIDLETIRKVEIIKGPLSSLYGAGLGGAILITPKLSGQLGNTASISTTHGSFGLVKNNISYGLNSKTASLNVSYHNLESDGWRENSAYHREGVTIAGELLRRENSKLTYFGNYTYMKAFIPSSIDRATFDNNPQSAAFTWRAAKGFEQYDSYLGGLSYEFNLGNVSNATSVFINHKDSNEPRPFDILDQNTTAYGARTQFSFDLGLLPKTRMIVGFEYFNDDFEAQTYQNLYQDNNGLGSLKGDQLTESAQRRHFYNAFTQLRTQLSSKFEIQAGLNLNSTTFTLARPFPANDTPSQKYEYDLIWAPQLSLLYKPLETTTLYISASRGFSLPGIEESLTPSGNINPNIKPETGYNYEVGGKFFMLNKKLFVEAVAFRMLITDLLVAQRTGDDQYVGVNAGETLHHGVELSANYEVRFGQITVHPFAALSVGRYEFTDFVSDGNDFSGNKLTGVPDRTISTGIKLTIANGLFLSGDLLHVGRLPLNDSNQDFAEAYTVLNIKSGYHTQLYQNLTMNLSAGINNAGDERYAAMVLPNATGFGTSQPRFYYPGMPVNYYANIQFAYNFL